VRLSVNGSEFASHNLDKNPNQSTTTYEFPIQVPTGPVDFYVTAYEQANPNVILSRVSLQRVLLPGQVNQIDFVLESTATQIEVQRVPDRPVYLLGDSIQFTPVAKNSSGAIILNHGSDFIFSTSDATVVNPDENGSATVLGPGTATVSVRERGNELSQLVGTTSITTSLKTGLYHVIDLGRVDATAYDINSTGQVVGRYMGSGGVYRPFMYDGTWHDLGSLGGTFGQANGINDAGVVVGRSGTASGFAHAFAWHGGSMTDLGVLPGTPESEARSVNAAGAAVGTSWPHAFLHNGSMMTDLGTLGGQFSQAYAVNAKGDVVGSSTPSGEGMTKGFLYGNGTMTQLPTLGGTSGEARGINSSGAIVGFAAVATTELMHAFLRDSDGTMHDLHPPGARESFAFDISDTGWIAGFMDLGNGTPYRAFVCLGRGPIVDLNTVKDSSSTNLHLVIAYAVNDNGWVVGLATDGVSDRAFLAVPR
jgi:probable HAF family extracellular repeat protein